MEEPTNHGHCCVECIEQWGCFLETPCCICFKRADWDADPKGYPCACVEAMKWG